MQRSRPLMEDGANLYKTGFAIAGNYPLDLA